jgi:hypothetical protein
MSLLSLRPPVQKAGFAFENRPCALLDQRPIGSLPDLLQHDNWSPARMKNGMGIWIEQKAKQRETNQTNKK